jgi:thiamine biosynthesis protein ThiI
MINIASRIAEKIDAPALISGESVGQVASQTLSNIRATGDAADRPILRPLCGMNKEDIVNLAQKIGTYELSIEPYEDCCSFFVPIHPETKADLNYVIKVESAIDFGKLFDEVMENITISTIHHPDYIKEGKKKFAEVDD